MRTEMFADSVAQLLTASGRRVVADETLWREPAQLRGLLSEAEALIVGNQPRVDAELVRAAPLLRVIGRLGVGLDI
jgi:phosphoglycerate dehydrogenase-like enzyme